MKKNSLKIFVTIALLSLSGCKLQKNKIVLSDPLVTSVPKFTTTPVPTQVPTLTPTPSTTPIPTFTPTPSATPVPTLTPTPTIIASPIEKMITLTFDDSPSKYTTKILDVLKEYNVKATFFVVDYNIEKYQDVIKRACEEGHEICIHSSHEYLTEETKEIVEKKLLKSMQILDSFGITYTTAYRPRGGRYTKELLNNIKAIGIKEVINNDGSISTIDTISIPVILWTSDSRDWENHDPDLMTSIALEEITYHKNGCIALFHDTSETTLEGIKKLIPLLLNDGYTFGTLTGTAKNYNVELEDGKVYHKIK